MKLVARLGAALLAAAPLATSASATELFGSGPLDLQAGGFVFVKPKYEGSKEYDVIGFPYVAPVGVGEGGWIKFKGTDDVRFSLLNYYGFEAGPVAGYRFGRDQGDADILRGLGDVDGGLVLGGYVAYRAGPVALFASYNHQVTDDDTGGLLRFGVEGKTEVVPQRLWVTATVGATYADEDYMSAYFGVTPLQSLNSGLAEFDASAGIKDIYLQLVGDINLTDRWGLKLIGRYSRLLGDAADSPVVESEDQFYGGLGVTYRFTVDR